MYECCLGSKSHSLILKKSKQNDVKFSKKEILIYYTWYEDIFTKWSTADINRKFVFRFPTRFVLNIHSIIDIHQQNQQSGGGLAVGSLLLIEEDKFATYSNSLNKFFITEGVVNSHSVFVVNLDDDPEDFVSFKTLNLIACSDNVQSLHLFFRYKSYHKSAKLKMTKNHHKQYRIKQKQTICE